MPGYFRKIIFGVTHTSALTNTINPAFAILRNGVYYQITGNIWNVNVGGASTHSVINRDIILEPTDILYAIDIYGTACTLYASVGYVDIPMDLPVFKKGRRG